MTEIPESLFHIRQSLVEKQLLINKLWGIFKSLNLRCVLSVWQSANDIAQV